VWGERDRISPLDLVAAHFLVAAAVDRLHSTEAERVRQDWGRVCSIRVELELGVEEEVI
jgi:hypothetical protein